MGADRPRRRDREALGALKPRVGIVGWGGIALDHAGHLAALGAEIAGVVSRRRDLELEWPTFASVDELLPRVDAITVAVPNHLHAAVCLEAVRAGKAVMVEKPICIRPDDLAELKDALPQARATVHAGFRLRFNPTLREIKRRVTGLRRVECTYTFGIEKLADGKAWTTRRETSGGAFCTLGIHTLDIARWLANAAGAPLGNLSAVADSQDELADFPLRAEVSGVLPSGVELRAGVDLRPGAESRLDLIVEADSGGYPDDVLPAPQPADEPVEFRGLFEAFLDDVRTDRIDPGAVAELLQCQSDLLEAERMVAGGSL